MSIAANAPNGPPKWFEAEDNTHCGAFSTAAEANEHAEEVYLEDNPDAPSNAITTNKHGLVQIAHNYGADGYAIEVN